MASLDLSKSFHSTSSFERELGNIEKEKIKKMLLSSVVIHDRGKKIHHRTSALTIINQFALSTIQIYGTHLRAFMQRDTAFHVEVLHTIRGSTATASLEQKELSSDLDLVIKCKILPNSFYDYGQFKKFCYAIAYDVLHKVLPSEIPGKIINIDALVDKTSGVFKSLYPFIDTSRCVYSMASLVEVNDETKDIDMDITLLFEPQHDLNPVQIPSPVIAKKSKVSPLEHTEERPVYDLDAKSFAHDAVEIVLPTKASRIDIQGKMLFSSLFQIPLSDVEHHLVHRNLIILDTKVFKGHCRFFYEITKGRLPLNTVEEEDLELKKSIELLSSSSEIKKSVEILISFIKGKKKDRSFFENFMINAYIVTQTLLNKIEETLDGRITLIHDQMKMFIDELEQGFCKEGHKYCDIQNPLGVLSKVATINSHVQKSIITFEKMSLGKKFRVSANNELMEGFTVVPSLTFRELFSLLESMQIHPDIYTDLSALHINNYTPPNWAAEDKWKFVYFLRKIEQESLSTEELKEIVGLFSEITPKIVQEKSLITKKTFTQVFLQFFQKHQSAFISKEEDFTLLRILRLATNQKETGLLGIISLMTLPKLPIDDALATDIKECLIQGYQCKKTGFFASYLVEMLNKIITIIPEGISPDIVPMIIHAINEQLEQKDISESVLFMSKLLLDKDPLALGRTIDFDLCDQLKVDMHEICKTNNTIFDHLSHEGKISVINWSIENQETALLSYCLIKKPMLSIRLLQGYIKKNQEEGLTTIQRLCKDVNIKKLFLIKATWFIELANHNRKTALSIFAELRSSQLKEYIATFIFDIYQTDTLFALKCLSITSPSMQQQFLATHANTLLDFFESSAEIIPNRILLTILDNLKITHSENKDSRALTTLYFFCLNATITDNRENIDSNLTSHLSYFIENILERLRGYRTKIKSFDTSSIISIFKKDINFKQIVVLSEKGRLILEEELFDMEPDATDINTYVKLCSAGGQIKLRKEVLVEKLLRQTATKKTIKYLVEGLDIDNEVLRMIKTKYVKQPDELGLLISEKYIKVEKKLRDQLFFLMQLVDTGFPSHLICNLADALDLSERNISIAHTFFQDHSKVFERCSDEVRKKIIERLIQASFASLRFSEVAESLKTLGESGHKNDPWYLKKLQQIFVETEKKFHLNLSDLLTEKTNPEKNILYHLHSIKGSTEYTSLINAILIYIEKRGSILSKNDHLFELIKECVDICNADRIQFFYAFTNMFSGKDLETLLEKISISSYDTLYKILHKCDSETPYQISKKTIDSIYSQSFFPSGNKDCDVFVRGLSLVYARAAPEELFREVERSLPIAVNIPSFSKSYKDLLQKALTEKNIPLLNLLSSVLTKELFKKDLDKKQNSFKILFNELLQDYEFIEGPYPIQAIASISAIWDIDPGTFLITLIKKLSSTEDPKVKIFKLIQQAQLLVPKAGKKTIDDLNTLLFDIFEFTSPSFYLEHKDFFMAQETSEIFEKINTHMIKNHTIPFLRDILSIQDPDKLKKQIRVFDKLCMPIESLNSECIPEAIHILQEKMQEILSSNSNNPNTFYNTVILCGLFGIFSVYAKSGYDRTSHDLQIIMPHIFAPNFVLEDDHHFLSAFCRICFSTDNVGKLSILLDFMIDKMTKKGISIADKQFYKQLLINSITPLYLIHNQVIRMPSEKIMNLLIQLDIGHNMNEKDLTFFIRFFEQRFSRIENYHSLLSTVSESGIFEHALLIQSVNLEEARHIEYFLESISKAPLNALSTASLSKVMTIAHKISLDEHLITSKMLRSIPSICEQVLQKYLASPEMELGLEQIKASNNKLPILESSLIDIAQTFYSMIPVMMTHIQAIKIRKFRAEHLDLRKIFEYYETFLKKLDTHIGKQGSHPFENLLHPFEAVHPHLTEAVLIFMQPLIDKSLSSNNMYEITDNLRLLVAICIYNKKVEIKYRTPHLTRAQERARQHVAMIHSAIFDIIKKAATSRLRLDIANATYILTLASSCFIIDTEYHSQRFTEVSQLLVQKEYNRPGSNAASILQIIDATYEYFIQIEKTELFSKYLSKVKTLIPSVLFLSLIKKARPELQALYKS